MRKVAEISPAQDHLPAELRHLHLAAYCRVSTELEEQSSSIGLQERNYSQMISANSNWENAGIFTERATGLSTKDRQEFRRMASKCRRKKIDLVLVKSISRFARNTVDCLNYIRTLRRLSIAVIFKKENINTLETDSEMLISMMEAFAQAESEPMSATRGGTEWSESVIRSILKNEKYCGDVLMQKTYTQNCISKKQIRNVGQLPMYPVQDNHAGIISRDVFNAVQAELARCSAGRAPSQKMAPTGRSCYRAKYALTERLVCGECGTLYRRCVWTRPGKKFAVWLCASRVDYGKKYCHNSPTLQEEPLQAAILAAINAVMSQREVLVGRDGDRADD